MSADHARAGRRIGTWSELVSYCGAGPASFTAALFTLADKADPTSLALLRGAFPRAVIAWEEWKAHGPLTRGELDALVEARLSLRPARPGRALRLARDVFGDPAITGYVLIGVQVNLADIQRASASDGDELSVGANLSIVHNCPDTQFAVMVLDAAKRCAPVTPPGTEHS